MFRISVRFYVFIWNKPATKKKKKAMTVYRTAVEPLCLGNFARELGQHAVLESQKHRRPIQSKSHGKCACFVRPGGSDVLSNVRQTNFVVIYLGNTLF